MVLAFTDLNLNINQNLAYSGVIAGTPQEEVRPYRSGKRDVMGAGNIVFASRNDIITDYDNNVTYEDCIIETINAPGGAFPSSFRVELDQVQLRVRPSVQSPNFDRILQPCSLGGFTDKFGTPADFRIVCKYSSYSPDGLELRPYELAA